MTTQKDLVKLTDAELGGLPVWAVEIGTEIASGGELLEVSLARVPQRPRRAA
jgi:hypothetical protein